MRTQWKTPLPLEAVWERYFIGQLFKMFGLFIVCFYGLYVLIDFSNRLANFHHHHIIPSWMEVIRYYAGDFSLRLEVLIPFGILIATIKTVTALNMNNELVALLAGGIKLRTLLRPFIGFGLFFVALVYINEEFLLPEAADMVRHVEDSHRSKKIKKNYTPGVQHLILEDHSTFLFQNYDTSKNHFFDSYWLKGTDEVYRIKFLYPYSNVPIGKYVDHFERDSNGNLVHTGFEETRLFPEIQFDKAALLETLTALEDMSLTKLRNKTVESKDTQSERLAQAQSVYLYKLAIPWLCLLAVIAPIPFCVTYSRHLPVFLIYAISIFGLVALYLILDAAMILSKRQLISPYLAVGGPMAAAYLFFGWRFLRIC